MRFRFWSNFCSLFVFFFSFFLVSTKHKFTLVLSSLFVFFFFLFVNDWFQAHSVHSLFYHQFYHSFYILPFFLSYFLFFLSFVFISVSYFLFDSLKHNKFFFFPLLIKNKFGQNEFWWKWKKNNQTKKKKTRE